MATKKKMLQAAAGQAGGAGLDITDVFSTYLYEGNGSTQTITNGIDLDGEGGLVWIKNRTSTNGHSLTDTERGNTKNLRSDTTGAESTSTDRITSFNADGFSLSSGGYVNGANNDYASWTFRKAPKFFDVVTYTGTGDTTTQTISHNLGAVPGCIIVKRTDSADSWRVYHRGVDVNGDGQPWTDMLTLNTTAAASDFPVWGDTAPTSTEFTVGYESSVNGSGGTYVAYVFAHNDGDGGFGPDADQDIIKCGSYTGGGSSDVDVNLGFEPQFVIVKGADISRGWVIGDIMRGAPVGSNGQRLFANTSDAETTEDTVFTPTPTGFKVKANSGGTVNDSGLEYIYMAIRRGPLAQPESGTEVFAIDTYGGAGGGVAPAWRSGFPVDMAYYKDAATTSNNWNMSRLTGTDYLFFDSTNAASQFSAVKFDYNNGYWGNGGTAATTYSWMWKRAPGFFDVVAYTGDGVAGRTVSHNLGVAPELIVTKRRESSMSWAVGVPSISSGQGYLKLQSSDALDIPFYTVWSNITASSYNVGADGITNASGATYISYLFATVPGVSKVGSYSGDGTTDGSKVIDCGFTSGARFVMIKTSNTAGDWMVYDTTRGIVVGNDPILSLNDTAAEATTYDNLIPNSSGFAVIQNTDGAYTTNESGHSYIFYAIA